MTAYHENVQIPKFLTVKAREGGPGSKIRFPLFFDNQIFHLCMNHYFLPRGVYSGWGIVVTVLVRPYVGPSEIFFEIFVFLGSSR